MKIHIVQKGDTLWKIAKKYGVNFEELKKMNSQLSNPDMIMPGMKIKVPSIGGTVKKEVPKPGVTAPLGVKKEMPIMEHPFAKEQPKPLPIVEAPVKEKPIVKEAPKPPVIPKMPLPVIPEIDINNYYMMNMANMSVQQPAPPPPPPPQPQPQPQPAPLPPKPIVMPEVKEQPVEVCPPIEACPPIDNCVPVSPIMPGPGNICPPGYPVQPMYPYQQIPVSPMPMMPETMPVYPGTNPEVAGTAYMPQPFSEESSSFMPSVPMMNPTVAPGSVMGVQNPVGYQPMQTPYMYGAEQMPPSGVYPAVLEMPSGMYSTYPAQPGIQAVPGGYAQGMPVYPPYPYYPGQYGQPPIMPGTGYVNPMMTPYGQMPYGETTIPGGVPQEMEMTPHVGQTQPFPSQPYGGTGGNIPTAPPVEPTFTPSTPPIYSAPYNVPNVAQPPYMNPYGMGPIGSNSYSMPRYSDEESDDN